MDIPKLAIVSVYEERGTSGAAIEWIRIKNGNLLDLKSRKGEHDE